MTRVFQQTKKKQIQKQKLHVVWFVDTAKTNTFTISRWLLWTIISIIALCVGVFTAALTLATKQSTKIKAQEEYIKELKASVVEFYMTNSAENSNKSDGLAQIETPLVAAVTPTQLTASETQETPAVAATLPRAVATAPTRAKPENHSTKMIATATNNPTNSNAQDKKPSLPKPSISFESFELLPNESGTGSIVKVTLVISKPNQPLTGYVCALLTLKNGTQTLAPHYGTHDATGCTRGIPVKFSRIRPTELNTNTENQQVQSVEIQFRSNDGLIESKKTFEMSP